MARIRESSVKHVLAVLAVLASAPAAFAAPSEAQCAARDNATPALLQQCIRLPFLWGHLSRLQAIADANPGPTGHGNRDTGTTGYRQSVEYVAGLMRQAGYAVSVQTYTWLHYHVQSVALTADGVALAPERDFAVARLSAAGTVDAVLQEAGTGCAAADFTGFRRGGAALLARGACSAEVAIGNAAAAGAAAAMLYNAPAASGAPLRHAHQDGLAFEAMLGAPSAIPAIAYASNRVGAALAASVHAGRAPMLHLALTAGRYTDQDYNLIADSPYGDARHTLVIEGHLDAIYGAGMLDNGSGSVSILQTALALAHTPTLNRLRYIWFGGEELGLLGSAYYTKHLTAAEKSRIAFDLDADVTATPNYDVLVASARYAPNVAKFPANVVPDSAPGDAAFLAYFGAHRIPATPAWFGNEGTDSNSFSLIGIPNTGILTQQDCCKTKAEVAVWGGEVGNYEGQLHSFNGGCVDQPHRWCDNLSNNDPAVFEAVSKAVATVTLQLANTAGLGTHP